MNTILHIGLPKTGSTFIQNWLEANVHILADSVSILPSLHGGHRLAVEAANHPAYSLREDFASIRAGTSLDEVAARLRLLSQRELGLVISSEYFYLASPSRIKEIFDRLGLTVTKVVCILRRQDRLMASGYAQDVKMLDETRPVDVALNLELYNWWRLADSYRAAFPGVDFVPLSFEALRRQGGLLNRWKDELAVSGVPTYDDLHSDELANESLPGSLVDVCRAANALGLPSLNNLAFQALRLGIVADRYRLPVELEEVVRDGYIRHNDKFVASVVNQGDFADYTSSGWIVDQSNPVPLDSSQIAKLLDLALRRDQS